MTLMDATPDSSRAESKAERLQRRGNEAREAVRKVWPELLEESDVDPTLLDLMLSRTVLERLDAGSRFQQAKAWLRGLPRARPSEGR